MTRQEFDTIKTKLCSNKNKLTQDERNKNVAKWTVFYRQNWDLFNRDILRLNLKEFQNDMIREISEGEKIDIIASRGLSKSYSIGVAAVDIALLYPNSEVLIVSETYTQANNVIDEKIDKELSGRSGQSEFLKQLRADGYMTIRDDKKNGGKIVDFGNGSKIFSLMLGEGVRSFRSTVLINDEAVRLKKKDIDSIAEPTLRPRQIGCLAKYPDYLEEPKIINATSAKNKTSWVWTDLKKCVEGRFKRSNTKYRFYAGDIYTAVAEKIQTLKQLERRRRENDDFSFQSEYLNIFLSENEDSMFSYADFEKNQILEKCFYLRTPEEYMSNELNPYKYRDNVVRIVVADIAMSATTDNDHDNDNTVLCYMEIDLIKGTKKIECIGSLNGVNSIEQTKLIKRAFYEYKAHYLALDFRGVGLTLGDTLGQETYDNEYGIMYPPIRVTRDRSISMCSDAVLDEKIQREITQDGEEVVIPIVATSQSNHDMHLAFRKALKDGTIMFLKDDNDIKAKLEDSDPYFIMKSAEEKAKILLPYMETKFMKNESVALETKFLDSGLIKLKEGRSATKDRYIACAYANQLADKILLKHNKDGEQGDFDIEDWKFLNGNFKAPITSDLDIDILNYFHF